jgi:hypothetical protein
MDEFERWASAVTDGLEDKLGVKNLQAEIFADRAIWQSRANRAVARPDDDGRHVTVVFDRGSGHRYAFRDDVPGAVAEITGRLIGLA